MSRWKFISYGENIAVHAGEFPAFPSAKKHCFQHCKKWKRCEKISTFSTCNDTKVEISTSFPPGVLQKVEKSFLKMEISTFSTSKGSSIFAKYRLFILK